MLGCCGVEVLWCWDAVEKLSWGVGVLWCWGAVEMLSWGVVEMLSWGVCATLCNIFIAFCNTSLQYITVNNSFQNF